MSAIKTFAEPDDRPKLSSSDAVAEIQHPEALADLKQVLVSHPTLSKEPQTDEQSRHVMPGITSKPKGSSDSAPTIPTAAPPAQAYSHPEISAEIEQEDLSVSAILAPASQLQMPTSFQPYSLEHSTPSLTSDTLSPTFSHPEISAEIIQPQDAPAPALLEAVSQAVMAVNLPETFSHPEISKEMSIDASSALAPQSGTPAQNPSELAVNDASPITFTHPEISQGLPPDDEAAGALSLTESHWLKSVGDDRPELIVVGPTSAALSHSETSEEIPSTDASVMSTSATSTPPAFSHPEISQEIPPTNSHVTAALASPTLSAETFEEARPTASLIGAIPVAMIDSGARPADTLACAELETVSLPETSSAGKPFGAKISEPTPTRITDDETDLEILETIPEVYLTAEAAIANTPAVQLSKEVPSRIVTGPAPTEVVSETGYDSEDFREVPAEISRDDRKAIIDALSRKTLSQDATVQPAVEGERKYVSDIAARKTITDHTKDAEAISSAEREALKDFAARRTVMEPDIALSPFDLFEQPVDIPVWYTNPLTDKMTDFEKAAYAAIAKSEAKVAPDVKSRHVVSRSEISEEVPSKSHLAAITSSTTAAKLTMEREIEPEMPLVERNTEINARARRKTSKDESMEVIPEEGKIASETPANTVVSFRSTDGGSRKFKSQPDGPSAVSGFQIDRPLMPFSKKERRELVRSISMRIIEPEAPLWDMDLADIKEVEEAEKNQQAPPIPFEPTFDFDDPTKPKVPVRRSKRHRIVRVHATDYARAQAVETQEFCTNKIKSTKYTYMTFIPVNLFLQFTRAANLYFILIAALQLIPDFSPTSWATTVAPLCFVLFLNAIKEFIDEMKRSSTDRTINKQKVEVLNENNFVATSWSSVIVGDIVRVKSEQEFPADLVFLSSADVKGLAYVETANLDGETNLKTRNAFYRGSSKGEDDETPYSIFSGLTIECELPNNRLYNFGGAINLQDYGKLPLDTRQVLLRGATLRNTEWILGVVVYTGADTKFLRNMIPGQVKVTELERNLNILVAIVFVCQVALCVALATVHDQWVRDDENFSVYIPDFAEVLGNIGPKPKAIGAQFGRFLILLNQLIPISLYVALEIVKVVQSYYIDWDIHMYHRGTQTHAKARTTSLNEELGQVQYVMADKTGTLTQNIMAFVQCSIGGVIYGTIQHEGGFMAGETKNTIHTLANDLKLIKKLKDVAAGSQDTDSKFLAAFFTHLAICHVVHPMFVKKGEEGIAEDIVLKYTGASPDEEALVQGAADCGYELKKRADDELSVFIPGLGVQKFVIMAVLEFTSERKRMSIICRDSKGRIKLYSKGADSVIFKRLARGQEELVETSLNQLEDFARCGYRTMCMAERQISVSEYEKWAARFRHASIALDDRDEKLASVSETIERDLMLLGVTAVEDKLQGKVPETITLLAQAGIKVWVLTGDKLETAVSVALSCNLLADSMHLFLLSDNVSKSVPQLLRSMLDEARRQHRSKLKTEGSAYQSEMATVIEGSSLTVALEESNKLMFLELLKLCRSVVCCRVSPIQKAQVTMLLKEHGRSVILAIGDGANDCGMIKAAQIGVGIGGREGMAAVFASDYSITRFRYLRRLLLVHGRWSYKRNRELVMYTFYKNIVYCMGNCYLAFYSGFSSQALYSSVEIATFNLIWTSLPTISIAVLNKDLSDCTAENNPQLYAESQLERRPQLFWCLIGWAIAAFWDSLVVFFVPFASGFASGKAGETIGIRALGSTIYTTAVFTVSAKMLSRLHNLTWLHFAAVTLSNCLWLLVFFCLSYSWRLSSFFPDLAGVGVVVTQSSFFWLLLLLCPVIAILPYWTFEIFRTQQAPADFEVMREIEHGWTDGYFFPDAPDFVEQLTAPIPERRTSLEFPELDDYGPSPMQKEIADAKGAAASVEVGGGVLSKPSEAPGTAHSTDPASAAPVAVQPPKAKADDKQLRPRRLTWREVVNDDELEDLATSESLGRDGRRRSSGFQVVTRHSDSAEAPVIPLAQGPAPTKRKSVMFEQGRSLLGEPTTVATRRSSLKPPEVLPPPSPPTPTPPPPHPEKETKQPKPKQKPPLQTKKKPDDSRLQAVRTNLAKHADERRALVPAVSTSSSPKRTTKKGQNIWAAVKEGSADHDPYYTPRDSPHPLQKIRPPGSSRSATTAPRPTFSPRSSRAGTSQGPRGASKLGVHSQQHSRFDLTTKEHSHTPHPLGSPLHTPRVGGTTPRLPKVPRQTSTPKVEGDPKDPKSGPGHSRFNPNPSP